MSSTTVERHEIKKKIENLKEKRAVDGHSTTLVTLIIPQGASIHEIRDLIGKERATAENIKSKQTRKHVKSALQSIHRRLKKYRDFPDNGLVIFCGVTQDRSLELHEIVPPRPIKRKRYLCDSSFHTEVLEEMVKRKRKYGVILVERDRATFGMVRGSQPEVLKDLQGYVPSKHGKGGQSQARFERLIEERFNKFLKKVASVAEEIFDRKEIEGILLGGPAYAKDELENHLSTSIKERIIGKVKTQYLGLSGLREALHKGSKYIQESRYVKEKEVMDHVMELAGQGSNRLTFGFDETFNALRNGRVETLIVKETLPGQIFKGKSKEKARPEVILDREGKSRETIKEILEKKYLNGELEIKHISDDPLGFLIEKAKEYGTDVKLISENGEPGEMLSRFNDIVGILRY